MCTEAEDFLGIATDEDIQKSSQPEISSRKRATIFTITWIAVLLVVCPAPQGIMMIPFFPLGLAFVFRVHDSNNGTAIVIGWMVYLALGVLVLTARTNRRFYSLYIVLLLLLLLNVGGYHSIFENLP